MSEVATRAAIIHVVYSLYLNIFQNITFQCIVVFLFAMYFMYIFILYLNNINIFLDKNELEQASTFLEQAATSNLSEFIKTLSDILRHGGNSPVARMAAGLQLKNQLTSKDPNVKLQYQQRWMSFPEEIRTYVKKNVSSTI